MKPVKKVKNWQLHHITIPDEHEEWFKEHFPNVIYPPIMFTGNVVNDPTGKFNTGSHMRSTYIIVLDRTNEIIETTNTIYEIDAKTEGKDIFKDMGNDVFGLFY